MKEGKKKKRIRRRKWKREEIWQNEDEIKEQERGRGNGIWDDEGNSKAGSRFLCLTNEIIFMTLYLQPAELYPYVGPIVSRKKGIFG